MSGSCRQRHMKEETDPATIDWATHDNEWRKIKVDKK